MRTGNPVPSHSAASSQGCTSFSQNGIRNCIHERAPQHMRKRLGEISHCERYGDDPWFHSQEASSDATTTAATGFHVMLASSGTLSIASSHSMQGSSSSMQDSQFSLLASSSQQCPLIDISDGEESEETLLDAYHARSGKLLRNCSSGSLNGESLFLNGNVPSSSSTMPLPATADESSLAAAVAAAVSAFGHGSAERDSIRQELRNPSWRRNSGSLEREASFECVIATKESLVQHEAFEAQPTNPVDMRVDASTSSTSPPRRAGFSWDGIATEVEQHVLSGYGQSGSSRSPFRVQPGTGSLTGRLDNERHLGSQIRNSFMRRQEYVIEGMSIGQRLATSGGCVSLESLQAALIGTSHDSFFHWFCNCHLAPGVAEVALFDFGTALQDFYLQEQCQDGETDAFLTSVDFGDMDQCDTLPQVHCFPGYGTALVEEEEEDQHGNKNIGVFGSSVSHIEGGSLPAITPEEEVVVCPWRETPLRREEVRGGFRVSQIEGELEMIPAVSSSAEVAVKAEANSSCAEALAEDVKRKWRRERVQSLERKCQELEQELGAAKRAQLFLQNELLTTPASVVGVSKEHGESDNRQVGECISSSQERNALDSGSFVRMESSSSESLLQYEQIVPPQALLLGSSVDDESSTSSTSFSDWAITETSDIGDKFQDEVLGRASSIGTSKRFLLSPVAEDPYREEAAAVSSEDDSSEALSQAARRGCRKVEEETAVELHKLSEIWDRFLSLGKTTPEGSINALDEIRSLNSLFTRLSTLMENALSPRENARRQRDYIAQDTDYSPEWKSSACSSIARSNPLPREPRETQITRATVPKLFGAPFNNCPPPPPRREMDQTLQDRSPSALHAPLTSLSDMRLPSPRERSRQSSPRDERLQPRIQTMYSPTDASLPSPRDRPPESPRDVRQHPRSRPPPSPREVPSLCTSLLPQLR